MKSYLEVYREHEGFVSDKPIHYFFIYDIIFKEILENNQPITILEIGVQNGGSLEIWKKYLPAGSTIYGVDINTDCSKLKFSNNIYLIIGNASDNNFMNEVFKDVQFDVILDDGSHICTDVIKTFKNMFKSVKGGGIYIIEDLATSYYRKYYHGGFKNEHSSIEYLKTLIDALNIEYNPLKKIFHRKQIKDIKATGYNKLIKQISFFDAMCAIYKYYDIKTTGLFESTYTGTIEEVINISSIRKDIEMQLPLIERIKKLFIRL